MAVGGTEEGGTGCRRALEGHKRGKGTHLVGHILRVGLNQPKTDLLK